MTNIDPNTSLFFGRHGHLHEPSLGGGALLSVSDPVSTRTKIMRAPSLDVGGLGPVREWKVLPDTVPRGPQGPCDDVVTRSWMRSGYVCLLRAMVGPLVPHKLHQNVTVKVFQVVGMIAVRLGGAKSTPIEETFALRISECHFWNGLLDASGC